MSEYRLPPIETVCAELFTHTIEELVEAVGPKAVRDARQVTCCHDRWDMNRGYCPDCGMTKKDMCVMDHRGN